MFQNTTVIPLHWKSIVDEALRRRKTEKITQREHAALANVSVPTMAAFERGDTALSLSKAFDILRVVGMVYEPSEGTLQDLFVKESFDRWQELNRLKFGNSLKRFPYGWTRFDYYLEGELKFIETKELITILETKMKHYSGLPPFYVSSHTKHKIVANDIIECRLNNFDDFWRADVNGHLFFIREHQEDLEETFPPQSIFDITIPIWRIAEALLHAEQLASFLKNKEDSAITVHFRALYTGLKGRVLRPWSMPDNIISFQFSGRNALSNEVCVTAELLANDISKRLVDHLYPLASTLYQAFGITDFPKELVEIVVKRLFDYQSR